MFLVEFDGLVTGFDGLDQIVAEVAEGVRLGAGDVGAVDEDVVVQVTDVLGVDRPVVVFWVVGELELDIEVGELVVDILDDEDKIYIVVLATVHNPLVDDGGTVSEIRGKCCLQHTEDLVAFFRATVMGELTEDGRGVGDADAEGGLYRGDSEDVLEFGFEGFGDVVLFLGASDGVVNVLGVFDDELIDEPLESGEDDQFDWVDSVGSREYPSDVIDDLLGLDVFHVDDELVLGVFLDLFGDVGE